MGTGPRGLPPWPTAASLGLLVAVLLVATHASGTLGSRGALTALVCAAAAAVVVHRGMRRAGALALGPADGVTLTRLVLACVAAGVVAEGLPAPPSVPVFLLLVVPALVLDGVDGQVARRTGTASGLGGWLDGESDAFLVLVLAVGAAPEVGWWVLPAGLARYAFGAGGQLLPWMRRPLPFRFWRKVVTASAGVGLSAAAVGLPDHLGAVVLAGLALALLAESFGRDVLWLWRRRHDDATRPPSVGATTTPVPRPARAHLRAATRTVVRAAALALGWFGLVAPAAAPPTATTLLRLPAEAVVVLALALTVPARPRRVVLGAAGTALGLLGLLRVLDLVTLQVRGRPFDVVADGDLVAPALTFLRRSSGPPAVGLALVAVLALLALALVVLPRALVSSGRWVDRHRRASVAVLAGLALGWSGAWAAGVTGPAGPLASAEALPYVSGKVAEGTATVRQRAAFEAALREDPWAAPRPTPLAALAGKDVVVVFVESYGRVALEGPEAAPVRDLLDAGTERLAAAGWTARSGFLASPVVGSGSWLAHATFQSGLPVADQHSYDELLTSDRTTLASAFGRAGWRTVAVLPSTSGSWPEGRAFYHLDAVRPGAELGYAGPPFGFSAVPDQFTLAALDRLELDRSPRAPVMAEVELTSSHWPWAPLPTTVDPALLGDGTVFRSVRAAARTPESLWRNRAEVPDAYRTSIGYALTSVLGFVTAHAHDDLVVLVLGDHQPSSVVTGPGAGRQVPVTILAHDDAVVRRTAAWGWQPGLRPAGDAPTWPMADFRDRFLATFDTPGGPAPGDELRRTQVPTPRPALGRT